MSNDADGVDRSTGKPPTPAEAWRTPIVSSPRRRRRFFAVLVAAVAVIAAAAFLPGVLSNRATANGPTLECEAQGVDPVFRNYQNAWFAQHGTTMQGAVNNVEVVVATVGQPAAAQANDMFVVWYPATCQFAAFGIGDANVRTTQLVKIKVSVNYDQREFAGLSRLDSAQPLPSSMGEFLFNMTDVPMDSPCDSDMPPMFATTEVDGNNSKGETVRLSSATEMMLPCSSK